MTTRNRGKSRFDPDRPKLRSTVHPYAFMCSRSLSCGPHRRGPGAHLEVQKGAAIIFVLSLFHLSQILLTFTSNNQISLGCSILRLTLAKHTLSTTTRQSYHLNAIPPTTSHIFPFDTTSKPPRRSRRTIEPTTPPHPSPTIHHPSKNASPNHLLLPPPHPHRHPHARPNPPPNEQPRIHPRRIPSTSAGRRSQLIRASLRRIRLPSRPRTKSLSPW